MITQREKDEQQAEYLYGDRKVVDTDLLTEGFADGAAYGRKDGIRRCIQRLLDEGYYPTCDAIKRLKELEADE